MTTVASPASLNVYGAGSVIDELNDPPVDDINTNCDVFGILASSTTVWPDVNPDTVPLKII